MFGRNMTLWADQQPFLFYDHNCSSCESVHFLLLFSEFAYLLTLSPPFSLLQLVSKSTLSLLSLCLSPPHPLSCLYIWTLIHCFFLLLLLLLPLCLSVPTDQLCQGLFFVFSHPGDEAASKRSRGWCVCLCVWCVCPSFLCPAILALTSVFFFVFCFAFAVDSLKWKKEKTVMTWGAADIRPGSSSRIRGGVFFTGRSLRKKEQSGHFFCFSIYFLTSPPG